MNDYTKESVALGVIRDTLQAMMDNMRAEVVSMERELMFEFRGSQRVCPKCGGNIAYQVKAYPDDTGFTVKGSAHCDGGNTHMERELE